MHVCRLWKEKLMIQEREGRVAEMTILRRREKWDETCRAKSWTWEHRHKQHRARRKGYER